MDWSSLKLGDRRGKLVIVEILPNKNGGAAVKCLCDCGKHRTFPACLVFGNVPKFAACNLNGCRQVNVKHGAKLGGKVVPEYCVWSQMIQRCTNSKNEKFPIYGGRGIGVCERWKDYQNFILDLGQRPSPSHTIERRDNNRGYEPDNCFWATREQQGRNRRTNRFLTANGTTLTVVEWAEKIGVNPDFLHSRIGYGWSDERIINEPKHKYSR